jgi:GNAT superfamily N-acetyltransferase
MREGVSLRSLSADDMAAAADVCRIAFTARLPWLAELHTPDETRAFFRDELHLRCVMTGAFIGGRLVGVAAWRPGWIEQLYVLPDAQGFGVGSALLAIAVSGQDEVRLWTFQANGDARRFYEARGFMTERMTDGDNEEREPDVLYRWTDPVRP